MRAADSMDERTRKKPCADIGCALWAHLDTTSGSSTQRCIQGNLMHRSAVQSTVRSSASVSTDRARPLSSRTNQSTSVSPVVGG